MAVRPAAASNGSLVRAHGSARVCVHVCGARTLLGWRSPSEEQLAVARHMTHSVGIWRNGA